MSEQGQSLDVDVIVIGGGIAGLWLLARLRQQGYQAVLLESRALGAGQTRYAQGIIHGGTKYALSGKLTDSSRAVARMPQIWRDCLHGAGEVDLGQAQVLSQHQYLWSSASLASRLAGFFASRVMQSRTRGLNRAQWPALFQNRAFRGQVYRLDEPVLDTLSVIRALAEPHRGALVHVDPATLKFDHGSHTLRFTSVDGASWQLRAQRIVLGAGEGNAGLLQQAGYTQPAMQRRPLKMVMLRGGLPQPLFAHCVDANVNPRLTITSHRDADGEDVWYLGGQLAEQGIGRSDAEQIAAARKELQALLPWVDFSRSEWATLDIDRAEPRQPGGKRPDNVFVHEQDALLTIWPTKLALAPVLTAAVLDALEAQGITPGGQSPLPPWPQPPYAVLPWQEEERWKSGH